MTAIKLSFKKCKNSACKQHGCGLAPGGNAKVQDFCCSACKTSGGIIHSASCTKFREDVNECLANGCCHVRGGNPMSAPDHCCLGCKNSGGKRHSPRCTSNQKCCGTSGCLIMKGGDANLPAYCCAQCKQTGGAEHGPNCTQFKKREEWKPAETKTAEEETQKQTVGECKKEEVVAAPEAVSKEEIPSNIPVEIEVKEELEEDIVEMKEAVQKELKRKPEKIEIPGAVEDDVTPGALPQEEVQENEIKMEKPQRPTKTEQLESLVNLFREGMLTKEEFTTAKAKFIGIRKNSSDSGDDSDEYVLVQPGSMKDL